MTRYEPPKSLVLYYATVAAKIVKKKNKLKELFHSFVTPSVLQWWIQDFPDGGINSREGLRQPITGQNICRKMHENEKNWTWGGGGA